MIFSQEFLSFLIYGSLVWCGVSALGLGAMLVRDGKSGEIW